MAPKQRRTAFDPVRIGERIREHRKAAGLTQAQLADKAGLVFETISRVENGKEPPSLRTLLSLADALGTSLDVLVGREVLSNTGGYMVAREHGAETRPDLDRLLQAAADLDPEAVKQLANFLRHVSPPGKR